MRDYVLAHLRDDVLLRDLGALVVQDRGTTARLLAHLAEVDARKLYAPMGYPSMFAYCVEELRFSEDAAAKRIQAARAARRFPVLFDALAEGRLHLSAVWLLAPHLTPESVQELIQSATHQKKSEIEALLARRFGREAPASSRIVPVAPAPFLQHAPGHVGSTSSCPGGGEKAAALLLEHAPGHVEMPTPSPERYFIQVVVSKDAHALLRRAQELLSHSVPSGDVAQVLERALRGLVEGLERQNARNRDARSEAGMPPRKHHPHKGSRHIPASIRRAVWDRDDGQCTFVGAQGRLCRARRFLELDHAEPVAQGGATSVENLRLRCRAHNQYEADRVFGEGFMSRKRDQARAAKAEARARGEAESRARADAERRVRAKERVEDLVQGLRGLGCRAHEARRAAEFAQALQHATLEEQMRASLEFIGRRVTRGKFTSGGVPERAT